MIIHTHTHTHTHSERIPITELINTPSPVLYMRTVKFYSLGKFQLFSTVLLNIVTMLYIRSLDHIHPITPGKHFFSFCFLEFSVCFFFPFWFLIKKKKKIEKKKKDCCCEQGQD